MSNKRLFVMAGILRSKFQFSPLQALNFKTFLCLFLLLGSALTALAQSSDDEPRVEVFAGYSALAANYKAEPSIPTEPVVVAFDGKQTLNGFNGAVTAYLTKNFGLTADVSGHYGSDSLADPLGGTISTKTSVYNILGGPQFKLRSSRRVRPFVHALGGVAVTRAKIEVPSLSTSATSSSTDFALALGGGLDVRVNKRFDLRVFQVDYNPVFLKDGNETGFNRRADNVRFSFGVVIK